MSNNIYQLPQCTCLAFFPTSDALNAHLDEYRARESYLSAQQEICQSHSKANDDDPDSDDDDPDVYEDGGDKTHNCPLKECDRITPFKTRKILRRHFQQHIKCEEVCVCCHQVSKRVSDYIRHAERHRDVGGTKATYIKQMCDELRDRAANELGLAESGLLSRVERRSKKRAREEGYIDSRTSGAQKAGLHTVDMAVMNELGFQHTNDTQAVLSSTQSATGLMPLSIAEPVATGAFPNMSTEVFYHKSIGGPTAAPDHINFDAPVNGIINFPEPWVEWMQAENRAGYIES
ncbi:hypothetical protein DL98DRAFT_522401 [Cadophora sp. DSE1049]|nr:hypothetical protein DL98DRAFT_522401 [Cadophora sp. DSE1049]